VLIFLSACTFLLWLVSQKIILLQSNPKNVNLDFNFNATLPFPAVTICNQSPYRYVILMGRISPLINPLRDKPLTVTPSPRQNPRLFSGKYDPTAFRGDNGHREDTFDLSYLSEKLISRRVHKLLGAPESWNQAMSVTVQEQRTPCCDDG